MFVIKAEIAGTELKELTHCKNRPVKRIVKEKRNVESTWEIKTLIVEIPSYHSSMVLASRTRKATMEKTELLTTTELEIYILLPFLRKGIPFCCAGYWSIPEYSKTDYRKWRR